MEPQKLKAALMNHWNDHLQVLPYGHGLMVFMPWTYSDDDAVTLFVEEENGAARITDHGSTYSRAMSSGSLSLESERTREAWRKAIGRLGNYDLLGDEDEISIVCGLDELGLRLSEISSACLRAEQVRLLEKGQNAPKFSARVTRQVQRAAESIGGAHVVPRAKVRLSSGRDRRITSLVTKEHHPQIWIQAVGGNNNQAREIQLEHCYHIFDLAEQDESVRVAVALGTRKQWGDAMAQELDGVSSDVIFTGDEPKGLDRFLADALGPEQLLPA